MKRNARNWHRPLGKKHHYNKLFFYKFECFSCTLYCFFVCLFVGSFVRFSQGSRRPSSILRAPGLRVQSVPRLPRHQPCAPPPPHPRRRRRRWRRWNQWEQPQRYNGECCQRHRERRQREHGDGHCRENSSSSRSGRQCWCSGSLSWSWSCERRFQWWWWQWWLSSQRQQQPPQCAVQARRCTGTLSAHASWIFYAGASTPTSLLFIAVVVFVDIGVSALFDFYDRLKQRRGWWSVLKRERLFTILFVIGRSLISSSRNSSAAAACGGA